MSWELDVGDELDYCHHRYNYYYFTVTSTASLAIIALASLLHRPCVCDPLTEVGQGEVDEGAGCVEKVTGQQIDRCKEPWVRPKAM